jgi:uncharacterized protein YjbI with pentapeptide repeats
MRILQVFFGILLTIVISVTGLSTSAQAASSGAIHAYDDVQVKTKDFSGQNLIRSEFSNARLIGSNFSGADLRGAVFSGSNLSHTNWHGVNFGDGIAYITDLTDADLTDAVLTSAMMIGSVFKNAKITGADFSFAVLDRAQVVDLCKTASGVNPVTGVETRESLECP